MSNKNTMGKTKRSTDDMIDDAISQQNDWLENRRSYARRFLKTFNIFARPKSKPAVQQKPKAQNTNNENKTVQKSRGLRCRCK